MSNWHSSLEELIKAKDRQGVAEHLRGKTGIDLGGCRIGDDGVVLLAAELANNDTVTVIGLSSNNIGNEGGKALSTVLCDNSTVTTIWLHNNEIGNEGGKALEKMFVLNDTVRLMDLSGNEINHDIRSSIHAALAINKVTPKGSKRKKQEYEKKKHVMISARFDHGEKEKAARDLYKELKNIGVKAYIVETTGAGDSFGPQTYKGLANMNAMVAVCFDDYGEKTASSHCSYAELLYAYEDHIPIIPIKLCDEWPPSNCGAEGIEQNKVVFKKSLLYDDWYGKTWSAKKCAEGIKQNLDVKGLS